MKEVADPWVVTVAENRLSFEMFPVMPQFVLDIGKLGVKLIFLSALRLVKVIVPGHSE